MAAAAGPPEADPLEGIRTFTLDLADLERRPTVYDDFLAEIQQYTLARAPFRCRNIPTTPTDGYFIIRLINVGLSVRLLIQEWDGYLVAVQRSDLSWFHFEGETPPAFIAKVSTEMNLKGSYVNLVPDTSNPFPVGPEQLRNAFYVLMNYINGAAKGSTLYTAQRRAFALMCIIFCEGRRFRPVKRLVSKSFRNQVADNLTAQLWKLIHSWSLISDFVLAYHDENGNALVIDTDDPSYLLALTRVSPSGITSMRDAVGASGVLLLILT